MYVKKWSNIEALKIVSKNWLKVFFLFTFSLAIGRGVACTRRNRLACARRNRIACARLIRTVQ